MAQVLPPNEISNTAFGPGESVKADGTQLDSTGTTESSDVLGTQTNSDLKIAEPRMQGDIPDDNENKDQQRNAAEATNTVNLREPSSDQQALPRSSNPPEGIESSHKESNTGHTRNPDLPEVNERQTNSAEGGAQKATTLQRGSPREKDATDFSAVDTTTSVADSTNGQDKERHGSEHTKKPHRAVSPGTKVPFPVHENHGDKIKETLKQEENSNTGHVAFASSHDQKLHASTSAAVKPLSASPETSRPDLDDGADFHKRSSATHNPIIKARDKLFPAGAGPAADAAPAFEQDPDFHPTSSKTHNPIIAVRDHLFPAGKGVAADTHGFQSDSNFHAKPSESHNPIIAIRDKLFPAGSGNPNDEHVTTHPRANDTAGHHNFPGFNSPAHPEHEDQRRRSSNVIVEPRTGLPMDLSRGTGKGGIDGNVHNPGYLGGGHEPSNPEDLLRERRKSSVIEPRTGLPMDVNKGTGFGGIDGNIHNPGYTGGGATPADPGVEADARRKSTVVEPHTGLPMDLRKGSGAGGIDGNKHIVGYQVEEPKA